MAKRQTTAAVREPSEAPEMDSLEAAANGQANPPYPPAVQAILASLDAALKGIEAEHRRLIRQRNALVDMYEAGMLPTIDAGEAFDDGQDRF